MIGKQMANLMKYWPLALAIFAITSAAMTAQFQLQLHTIELADLSESIDELEELVEELQYLIDG